jgi:tripartite-type tricarboxylate transporter receptor subunit TctC
MQNRVLYSKLPYNLDKDLTPIAAFPSGPLVVAVAPEVPARNLKEFVAWAKGRDLSMGSYAPGSYPHMMADLFNRDYGLKVQAIQYRGEAPMWVDVASGQVQIAVGSYQAFNTVSTRGVKPIAVTGNYRSPKLPDVATMIEQGATGTLVPLDGGLWLMAPAGTPEAVLQILSNVVVKGAASEQAAKLRESFSIPNKPQNLADTRRDWDRSVPAWIKAAADLGVKLD